MSDFLSHDYYKLFRLIKEKNYLSKIQIKLPRYNIYEIDCRNLVYY